jgi:hypothetical protein
MGAYEMVNIGALAKMYYDRYARSQSGKQIVSPNWRPLWKNVHLIPTPLYPQKQWTSTRNCQFDDHLNIAHKYIDNLTALLLAISA